jgi:hypothetical protein
MLTAEERMELEVLKKHGASIRGLWRLWEGYRSEDSSLARRSREARAARDYIQSRCAARKASGLPEYRRFLSLTGEAAGKALGGKTYKLPSTRVGSQNTNVLRLIVCTWFCDLPRMCGPTFVELSIRFHCRLSERRRVTLAAQ